MLVRYADDAIVMCNTREQAEAALMRLTALLAELGLEPKAAKTRIVHLVENGPGLHFLGFHHRLVRGRTPRSAASDISGPLAFTPAGAACPGPDPDHYRPAPTAGATWADRAGTELVATRLGGVLPIRELRVDAGSDQKLCPATARVMAVQTRPPAASVGLGHDQGSALTSSPGIGAPGWNRRSAQTLPGLARLNAAGEERR